MLPARVFSILIPTWNNLPMLRLCVESLRRNSTYRHQIIVHVNDGSDGTLDYVKAQGLDYTHSPTNIGVCLAMNMMRTKVSTDYIVFFNDDMYALPHWDDVLYDEILALPDKRFYLASVAIQRGDHVHSPHIEAFYGDDVATFRERDLLNEYMQYKMSDRIGAIAPPTVVHRDVWDMAGGYSVEFSPGLASDPDFTAKLWLVGVRYMKMLGASRCYHFQHKTVGRAPCNDGPMQFLLKWGLTGRTFRMMTHNAAPFDADICGTQWSTKEVRRHVMRSRLKAVWWAMTRRIGPIRQFFSAS